MATQAIAKPSSSEVSRVERTRSGCSYVPNVDILETPTELTVLVDMPGVTKKDIDIRFENGALTIHGRVSPRQPEGTTMLLAEYGVGDFYRRFEISETIDSDRITAAFADGVLTLHLPKVEAAQARKIDVKNA